MLRRTTIFLRHQQGRHHVFDRVETIAGATIQHGHQSSRVYIMKFHHHHRPGDDDENNKNNIEAATNRVAELVALAQTENYGKVIAKVKGSDYQDVFQKMGFVEEARIPSFYPSGEAAVFCSQFLDPQRALVLPAPAEDTKKKTKDNATTKTKVRETEELSIRKCNESDAVNISAFYQEKVFETYPFPIFDPSYVRSTMVDDAVEYFCIAEANNNIIAIASTEKDATTKTVEMTDFGTDEAFRGRALARRILSFMEERMREQRQRVLFSIARTGGMSNVFAGAGYTPAGTLKNNTQISGRNFNRGVTPGRIESMNVWFKHTLLH